VRFGFVTCVQLGLSCIQEILDLGGRPELLVTLEDQRATAKSGRIYLDAVAERNDIPLHKCANINDSQTVTAIQAADLDWLFIVGWSQIAREPVLSAARQGALGMHPTLLPIGRGRASIPWAILKELPETGVTLFKLDVGVDTGPILGQQRVSLAPEETATTLYSKVTNAHLTLLRDLWPRLADNSLRPTPQDSRLASEWPGRTPEDGEIKDSMTVAEVDRLVRATTKPYPGAFVKGPNGPVTVWAGTPDHSILGTEAAALGIHVRDGEYFATSFEARGEAR
jgi:methionyl-tRNA formyltransferase